MRQWDDPQYPGTRIAFHKAEFVEQVHAFYSSGTTPLVDGYAPFCKHIFVPNFVCAKLNTLEITDENRHLLSTGYTRRRPEELAVLTRWFPKEAVPSPPKAAHLDIILYSRDQLKKEYDALPSSDKTADLPDVPWGIISIKAQNEDFETPMQPMTILRNALGRDQGGSGVPLEREKYEESVAYWETHAVIQ